MASDVGGATPVEIEASESMIRAGADLARKLGVRDVDPEVLSARMWRAMDHQRARSGIDPSVALSTNWQKVAGMEPIVSMIAFHGNVIVATARGVYELLDGKLSEIKLVMVE